MVRAFVLLLGGCQVVFPLEETVPDACAHDGIELCLTFEDNVDDGFATDGSSRKLDATATNATNTRRDIIGVVSERALELTTDSSVFQSQVNAFDLQRPFSIDLWVLWTEQPAGQLRDEHILIDNSQEYTLTLTGDGFLHWGVVVMDATGTLIFPENSARTELSAGSWHHVAAVLDDADEKLYVDGVIPRIEASLAWPGDVNITPTQLLRFGSQSEAPPGRQFTGQIDNLRLWKRALTDDEISRFALGNESE